MTKDTAVREEQDSLGRIDVPENAYYGAQTRRALENFHLADVPLASFPCLVTALAMIKQAAARANHESGYLGRTKFAAIDTACDRIIAGEFDADFVVDMIQGGSGTSTNMNANEVITNVALESLGYPKGAYPFLQPNNDVNMAQSTNDVYPSAIRLGILLNQTELIGSLDRLCESLRAKEQEFSHVLKTGRTQLQDAVPMTLGQEFGAFANTLLEDLERLRHAGPDLMGELNLGGTAIGTGINSDTRFQALVISHLATISGQPLIKARDLIEATSDTGPFVLFSGMLKRLAIKLSKICGCCPAARVLVSTKSICRHDNRAARSCPARSTR